MSVRKSGGVIWLPTHKAQHESGLPTPHYRYTCGKTHEYVNLRIRVTRWLKPAQIQVRLPEYQVPVPSTILIFLPPFDLQIAKITNPVEWAIKLPHPICHLTLLNCQNYPIFVTRSSGQSNYPTQFATWHLQIATITNLIEWAIKLPNPIAKITNPVEWVRQSTSALAGDLDLYLWVFPIQNAIPGSVWVSATGWLAAMSQKLTGSQVLVGPWVPGSTHKYSVY
jgi:hypothetical protein